MSNFKHLLLAGMALVLFACDKEDTNKQEAALKCKPIKIISSDDEEGYIYSSDVTLTYNGNLLTKMVGISSEYYCYEWDAEEFCEEDEWSYELNMVYNGNQVTRINFVEDGSQTASASVTYADGKISTIVYEEVYQGFTYKDEYRYTYTANKLSKVENWDNYSGGSALTLYGYQDNTWTGDNITKTQFFVENPSNARKRNHLKKARLMNPKARQMATLAYQVDYTYDDKLNPFRPYAFFFDAGIEGSMHGKNNPLTARYEITGDGQSYVFNVSYNYQYNSDGFPLSTSLGSIQYNCN